MNLRVVSRYLAGLLFIFAIFMMPSLGLAIYDGDTAAIYGYGITSGLLTLLFFALKHIGSVDKSDLHRKDAFGVVGFIWIVIGVFGGLPFYIEGSIPTFSSAMFEAVSGFTTTGATVVADVGALSRATNFWRCISHWIGGMGIVVLFVAIFPQLGVGAKHLFKSEVPGPISEGLKPRIKQTALRLWWIYASLTLVCGGFLVFFGMPIFDAVCHAFSILSTGGFSTKAASIGAYKNVGVEWVCVVFMLMGGLNFGLYYACLQGKIKALFSNYEFRFYIFVNLFISGVLTYYLLEKFGDFGTAFRYASFQTLAVTTTTGLMTDDFNTYPEFAKFILFLAMFMGGCAGSTAGGIKASRIFIGMKAMMNELWSVIHPQRIRAMRVGTTIVSNQIVSGIMVFFVAYFLIFAFASAIMVALGLDFISAMSSVVACLSSVGPGLGSVGPIQNYEFIPALGKFILCFCMIAGRLEIFVLLSLFSRETWKR